MNSNKHELKNDQNIRPFVVLPQTTIFDRRIPKSKFYENLSITPQLKRVFIDQISQIVWQNKIAPSTTNLAEGEYVSEVEVFVLKLNQRGLDEKALQVIDREIPYHILFLLEYGQEVQAWISYKEASRTKEGTFKPGIYYHTEWMPIGSQFLKLDGLNMDVLYENLVRQVAGKRLALDTDTVKEAIELDEFRQKINKKIAVLEKRVQKEKQFSRQIELNDELKRLRAKLEENHDI